MKTSPSESSSSSSKMVMLRDTSSVNYKNKSDEFLIKERTYKYQYAPLYAERLTKMRGEIKKIAESKWNHEYKIKSLVELEKMEKCIIIGTLFKEMKNKPSILKEIAAVNAVADEQDDAVADLASTANDQQQLIETVNKTLTRQSYIDESDQMILEDELQRIELAFAKKLAPRGYDKDSLCTGLVVALLGHENEESKFEVEDYCFKATSQITPTSDLICKNKEAVDAKYVMFLSGMELGDAKATENQFKLQLLIDYISGDFIKSEPTEAGVKREEVDEALKAKLANTVRLIIAGNSLSSSTQSKDMQNKAKYLTKNFVANSVTAVKQLDGMLETLSDKLTVDLMPGEFDPSNMMLPQQPLNASMFTQTRKNLSKTFFPTTNPYRFQMDNVEFLGSSGQFIDDIRRTTNLVDPLDIMKLILESGHIAPTCPDTLACYPYYGKDPFILETMPNVFFAGNQTAFKHAVFELDDGFDRKAAAPKVVHLLSVPAFKITNSCVLFNLNTFECEEIFF